MESEEIYRRIQLAIMERRLVPGAKLVEERLAEVTGAEYRKRLLPRERAEKFGVFNVLGRSLLTIAKLAVSKRLGRCAG